MKKKMGSKKEMTTKVTAKIEDVCQKKGCWMNLVDNKGNKVSQNKWPVCQMTLLLYNCYNQVPFPPRFAF